MLRRPTVLLALLLAIGCASEQGSGPKVDTADAESLTVDQVCAAYAKGDQRFTGKVVRVTGPLFYHGEAPGGKGRNLSLGACEEGTGCRWVDFDVPAEELGRIPRLKFGAPLTVEGICLGVRGKKDSLMVRLKEARLIVPGEK